MRTALPRRLALVTAAAAALALALPAGAATKPALHISDPVGDANGVNGQGFGAPVPSRSTAPASVSGADITSIDFRTKFIGTGQKRRPYGFDVTLKLAGALQRGATIVVTMDTSVPCGESSRIQLGYGTSSLAVCQGGQGSTATTQVGTWDASKDGKSVTWHIDPIFKPGVTMTNVSGSTSVFVLGVFDEVSSGGVYKYGK